MGQKQSNQNGSKTKIRLNATIKEDVKLKTDLKCYRANVNKTVVLSNLNHIQIPLSHVEPQHSLNLQIRFFNRTKAK